MKLSNGLTRALASVDYLRHPLHRAITGAGGGVAPVSFADFAGAHYSTSAVTGTKRYAVDPLDSATLGVYAEVAGRNHVHDSAASTTGGPGGLPTPWVTSNSIAGITPSLVSSDATGFVIRLQGTAGSTGSFLLTIGSASAIVAAIGEVWQSSLEVQRVSATGVDSNGLFFVERGTGGAFVNMVQTAKTFQTDTLFPESFQRTIVAGPRITMGVYVNATSGAVVDATYKFNRPQLEKSAYPTSYIATPAADGADRVADSLIAAAPQTVSSHLITAQLSPYVGTGTLLQFDDGTNNNRVTLRTAGFDVYCDVYSGGVQTASNYLGRALPMTAITAGVALTATSVTASFNGKPAVTAAVTVPAMSRTVLGGGVSGAWGGTLARYFVYASAFEAGALASRARPLGLFDDFDRAAGALGAPPTGQAYNQFATYQVATIDASKFLVSANSPATASTATYNAFDYSRAPSRFACAVAFSSGTSGTGNATLISNPNGMTTVPQITDGSFHIGFLDVQISLQGFPGGVFTTYANFLYPSACARDGATIYNFAWRVVGNGVIVLMPDGSMRRLVSAALVAAMGRYLIYESYWQGADATASAACSRSKFKAVAAY